MRYPFVDETLADVAAGRVLGEDGARDLCLLKLAIATISQQVVLITGTHDPNARQREGNTRGVDGDPSATPLFGNIGSGTRATGWVKYEVAWISGHKNTTGNDFRMRLDNINLSGAKATIGCIYPKICPLHNRIICE